MKVLKILAIVGLSILLQASSLLGQETDSENLLGQQVDSTKTLFSSFKLKTLGLYIAPEATYGQYAGAYTGLGGASAMLLINNKWAVGAHVQSNEGNSFTPSALNANKALALRVQNAGLRIEYIIAPHKVFHFSFPLTLGVGEASVDSVNSTSIDLENEGEHGHGKNGFNDKGSSSNFGYVQPGLNLEVNVFRFGKIFLGASYRLATNILSDAVAPYTVTTAQLSGLNINLGAKIGFFNYKVHKVKVE